MKNILNLDALEIFLLSAETKKFNAAAELSFKSPSAVTVQIKKLEEQLGTTLFIREKDSLRLTESGKTLYIYAKEMFSINQQLFNSIKGDDDYKLIRIGLPTDYGTEFARAVLPLIKSELPNCKFHITCSRSRHIYKDVESIKQDLGIIAVEDSQKNIQSLWSEKLHWVCSNDFILNDHHTLPIALFSDDCIVNTYSLFYLRKSKCNFDIIFSSSTLDNITEIVESGIAISLLPESRISNKMHILDSSIITCDSTLNMGLYLSESLPKNIKKKLSIIIINYYKQSKRT